MIAGFSIWHGLREQVALDASGASTRPGIYVAGDLGGAPVIKAAIRSGDVVARAVDLALGSAGGEGLDVVVIGAGPAGLTAAAHLVERGRKVVVVERDAAFHTIDAFPRGKPMYAEPRGVDVPGPFAFEDSAKEALVGEWRRRADALGLDVRRAELEGIDGSDGAFVVRTTEGEHAARKVIIALGRRGTPRRLDVPGADLPHVHDQLDDPEPFAGRDVLVVGGGDSAVEAAVALADAGANVTICHRGAAFSHAKRRNRDALAASVVGKRMSARVVSITPTHAVIESGGRSEIVPCSAVFALIGTDLPRGLLERLGLRLTDDRRTELARVPALLAFAALVWCFYVLKQHRDLPPFAGVLGFVHEALRVPVPWFPTADGAVRVLDAGFFGTLTYTLVVLVAGLAAMRRHPSIEQRWRYVSLIAFQVIVLFGVPEILAPIVTSAPGKLYTIGVPWPLSIWSLSHEPAAWGWLLVGALVSFVAIPLYVWRHNEKFCSWMCGCGGLAETLGDLWRWRAPRGDLAKRAEWAGVIVLSCAVPVTLLVLNDLWGFVGAQTWLDETVTLADGAPPRPLSPNEGDMHVARAVVEGDDLHLFVEKFDWDGAWHDNGWIREIRVGDDLVAPVKVAEGHYTIDAPSAEVRVIASGSALSRPTDFARSWYGLVVDFALASIVGVALYPFLGNRVWCRFFCPLRAYMEAIAARIGRKAIVADERCISCGECTKNCQMGIPVQEFAEQQRVLDNTNSACIQCGICVEVCPMNTLSLVDRQLSGP